MNTAVKLAGLIGVAGIAVAAAVAAILLLTDIENLETTNRCTDPTDFVDPEGSCAPVFRRADFAAGRARIALTRPDDSPWFDATVVNTTRKLRSFDWRRIELTGPDGQRIGCSADDSTHRLAVPPDGEVPAGRVCRVDITGPGRYTARYDGTESTQVDLTP